MLQPIAHVRLRWLFPEEGGRSRPFAGREYAATARFAGDSEDELFSIVLRLDIQEKQGTPEAELSLLFPDRLPEILEKLVPGSKLWITEGRRVVAECTVTSAIGSNEKGTSSTGKQPSSACEQLLASNSPLPRT